MKYSFIVVLSLMTTACTQQQKSEDTLTHDQLLDEAKEEFPGEEKEIDELYGWLTDGEVESTPPENIAYTPNGKFEKGKLVKRTYSNAYFGFTLTVPDNWTILSEDQHEANIAVQEEKLNEKDERLEKTMDDSKSNWNFLLSLQKEKSVSTIMLLAEEIEPIPNVTNALEYMEYTRSFIMKTYSSGYPLYTDGGIITDSVGNRPFLCQTFEIEEEDNFYYQKGFSAQFDEYLLTFVTNYQSKDEWNEIRKLLNQIEWS